MPGSLRRTARTTRSHLCTSRPPDRAAPLKRESAHAIRGGQERNGVAKAERVTEMDGAVGTARSSCGSTGRSVLPSGTSILRRRTRRKQKEPTCSLSFGSPALPFRAITASTAEMLPPALSPATAIRLLSPPWERRGEREDRGLGRERERTHAGSGNTDCRQDSPAKGAIYS